MRGYLPEARDKANRILQLDGAPKEVLLKAYDAAGGIAYWQGDMLPSREWYEKEGALAVELGDDRGAAEAKYNESFTYSLTPGEAVTARALAQDALDRFRRLGDRNGEGKALWGGGQQLHLRGRCRAGAARWSRSRSEISRELGDRFQLGWALFTKGLILNKVRRRERRTAARTSEAMAIFRETEDVTGLRAGARRAGGRGLGRGRPRAGDEDRRVPPPRSGTCRGWAWPTSTGRLRGSIPRTCSATRSWRRRMRRARR